MNHSSFASALPLATELVSFINKSVTPFHAVREVSNTLRSAGFVMLKESEAWPPIRAGSKIMVTRNDSSIVAFTVGKSYTAMGQGLKLIGTHTDSPNFQLKPKTFLKKGAMLGVGVQCYGGGLWHTWFDRELTVAGRVVVLDQGTKKLRAELVHVEKPLMSIPSLCIHLRSQPERDAFSPNKETQLVPLIATELCAKLNSLHEKTTGDQNPVLFDIIAKAANCNVSEICDFDMSVVGVQDGAIGGAFGEFIYAPRIDNLLSCFCAMKALLAADVESDKMISMVAMFDHEEVGSDSSHGAAGTLVSDLLDRICNGEATTRATTIANSFFLSVDCAHAAHPNYLDKHEDNHRPSLHEGPVIKYNANQRYATNGYSGAVVLALAKIASVPVQQFCVKNDSPCGSTIGPILSTLVGIKAADIGNPMLGMHSVRETCGTVDVLHLTKLLTTFFTSYNELAKVE